MRRLLTLAAVLVAVLTVAATVTTARAADDNAKFGQCIAHMAQMGPNDHAAMMGLNNFGEVVKHCQTMHDPPRSR